MSKLKIGISGIVILALCLVILPGIAIAADYNISGYVLNPYTGDGIAKTSVVIGNQYYYTNETGYYNFSNIADGTYELNTCIAIYQCNTTLITINGADITNFNITLSNLRPKADSGDKAEELDDSAYISLMRALGLKAWGGQYGTGGNDTNYTWGAEESLEQATNKTGGIFDWEIFSQTIAMPFIAIMGNIFFVFLFGMPFLMQWLRQENMLIPCVTGILFGSILISFLPVEFHLLSILFIAMGITGVLYIAYKERG